MKHLKLFEKWINTDKEIKKYLVLKSRNVNPEINNRFAIMEIVRKFTKADGVEKIELRRIYLFDLETGKDINDEDETWTFTTNYVIKNIEYQSNNLQDLIDIKDMLLDANKYNI